MELTKAGVALIGDHARREQEAQHTIPFTDQEIQFLKSIEECQNLICAKTEQPLPVPFTNALTSVSAGFGKAVEHTGAAAEKLAEALPFVAVAAVVVGGVMLMKH
jgi:exonuclease I